MFGVRPVSEWVKNSCNKTTCSRKKQGSTWYKDPSWLKVTSYNHKAELVNKRPCYKTPKLEDDFLTSSIIWGKFCVSIFMQICPSMDRPRAGRAMVNLSWKKELHSRKLVVVGIQNHLVRHNKRYNSNVLFSCFNLKGPTLWFYP